MVSNRTTPLAFTAALITAGVLNALWSVVVNGYVDAIQVGGAFVVAVLFALLPLLVLALPLYLLLKRVGLVNFLTSIASGALIGALFGTVLGVSPVINTMQTTALFGAASALVFWLVWRTGYNNTSPTAPPA